MTINPANTVDSVCRGSNAAEPWLAHHLAGGRNPPFQSVNRQENSRGNAYNTLAKMITTGESGIKRLLFSKNFYETL